MVFEQFLESSRVKKHVLNILMTGVFYVLFAYLVSAYFFPSDVSIAIVFTATLLLTPSIYSLLSIEEEIESREGTKHFFRNHKDIFKIYVYLFIGIFAAFLVLGSYVDVFSYQEGFLAARGDLAAIDSASAYSPSFSNVSGIITNNLLVVIIAFVLSIFYGAGALFLIVLNASVFAAFILHAATRLGSKFAVIGLFLIHLLPEIAGFLAAALAGGVVSRAIMKEKIGSKKFKNVLRDALILLLISAGLIMVAAFLEVYVSGSLVVLVI